MIIQKQIYLIKFHIITVGILNGYPCSCKENKSMKKHETYLVPSQKLPVIEEENGLVKTNIID